MISLLDNTTLSPGPFDSVWLEVFKSVFDILRNCFQTVCLECFYKRSKSKYKSELQHCAIIYPGLPLSSQKFLVEPSFMFELF